MSEAEGETSPLQHILPPAAPVEERRPQPPVPAAAPVAEPVPPREKPRGFVLADTEFSYVPVWEVRRNVVFCYLCEPFWKLPDGQTIREDALGDQLADIRRLAAVDTEVLRDAAAVADDILEHDRMAQLLVPVHFRTLASRDGADRYSGAVRSASIELHERIFLEIVGVPADFDRDHLARVVEGLRSVCRGVFARVDFGFRRFADLATCHVYSVGLSLSGDNRREADIIADFTGFIDGAAAASIKSHVHGIRTTSVSVAAVCAGFDLVGSEGIGTALEGCVMDNYLVKPTDIYKRLMRKTV